MKSVCRPVYIDDLAIGGEGASNKEGQNPNNFELTWKILYPCIRKPPSPVIMVVSKINQYEKIWDIQLPQDLKKVATWKGIGPAIFIAFPINNRFIVPGDKTWSNETIDSEWTLEKFTGPEDFMIRIMDENEGCCYWYAGWKKDNNHHSRIYVSSDCDLDEFSDITLTGDSLCTFFQDYASKGNAWYEKHRNRFIV